jgi:hypothetical protein
MNIANDGTGTSYCGNYDSTLSKWGRPNVVWKRGRIVGFDRQKRGPWDLMFLVLLNIVGSRNGFRAKGIQGVG